EDAEEIYTAIEKLAVKYAPHSDAASRDHEIRGAMDHMAMVCIHIEHMTGKEARELASRREK
ncbi:MAG: 5-nitroimidazole antibiotic resistance protein, partial [Clostridia bacterium]|nr:5-nitroimidazole antibiotic resistance protein [Clostridia bacterium]